MKEIQTPDYNLPPIVERNGQKFAVVALTDLDGTANDETLPEKDRLASISPATQTIHTLEEKGIPTGIITSRSHGEAVLYANGLQAHGPIICEDGAVLVLPHKTIVLSTVTQDTLQAFINRVQEELRSQGDYSELTTTLTTSAERLRQVAGHPSVEFAQASADRVASAYIAGATERQREVALKLAPVFGIRAFGEVINLIGQDANKGRALRALNDNIRAFSPDADGIIPVVFGNNRNDLKLFEEAERMGGVGVLISHPQGGYFVDEAEIPLSVIKTSQPYGYGMKESLPQVFGFLRDKYQLQI